MPGTYANDEEDGRGRDDRDDRDDDLARYDGDREQRVANRPNPLPSREEDEEELAEADILEELDLDDFDDADDSDDDLFSRA
jgi:hypothetical protein